MSLNRTKVGQWEKNPVLLSSNTTVLSHRGVEMSFGQSLNFGGKLVLSGLQTFPSS